MIISCFFDFTIADVLSVNLLKNAGGWEAFGGEREPILQVGKESQVNTHTYAYTHKPRYEKLTYLKYITVMGF